MDRSAIIGKRIARLLRSPFEYEKSDPDLRPGISLGVFTDFRVYIQLDDRSVIRFGLNRRYDQLCVVDPAADELASLVDYEFDAGEATCAGETIVEALACAISDGIFLYLSSGRYLWIEREVNGIAVYLCDEEWFTENDGACALEMVTYWGNRKTDYGGAPILRKRFPGPADIS